MNDFHAVTINVVASLLFLLLGLVSQALMRFIRHRESRRFWGGGVRRVNVLLVLGVFPQFRGFEPSGLLGVGDTRAVYELTQSLTRAGVGLEIAYTTRLEDGQLNRDLILLGGTDVNGITKIVEKSDRLGFRFEYEPILRLRDVKENADYHPETVEVDLAVVADIALDGLNVIERDGKRIAGQITTDYGVIARLSNPFSPQRNLTVVAGIYGYGTWGGARLFRDEAFLKRCTALGSREFECLYRVDIMQGFPIIATPIILRPLP